MWISRILLENIRGFVGSNSIEFAKNINLFVGQNNSGKSTILNSILSLQQNVLIPNDITHSKDNGRIVIFYRNPQHYIQGIDDQMVMNGFDSVKINFIRIGDAIQATTYNSSQGRDHTNFSLIPSIEPKNAIYPYLSKRKVSNFIEEIREQHSITVTGNLQNLYNKIDRIANPYFQPAHDEYKEACEKILGFPISTIPSGGGKRAAYIIKNMDHIPLTAMGEGVSNLLGLIVDLCMAENKIFLIEEPENDVHPKALKALLELIEKKSETNQFFISTHSNIVTKYLGSVYSSNVFKVSMSFNEQNKLPTSKIENIVNEPTARLQLLEELGYEPFDFGHWKAWLILEESFAEVIIRDFLIPTFVPKLKNELRTYSAKSLSEVEPKFKDFNNLFVFIHLEQIYKNKAWVLVDAGENEHEIVNKMKDTYTQNGWNEDNFLQFSQHDFERYYPERFQPKADSILEITNKKQRMEQKKALIEEVKQWIKDNPDDAKLEFAVSAKEVIDILKTINKQTE